MNKKINIVLNNFTNVDLSGGWQKAVYARSDVCEVTVKAVANATTDRDFGEADNEHF